MVIWIQDYFSLLFKWWSAYPTILVCYSGFGWTISTWGSIDLNYPVNGLQGKDTGQKSNKNRATEYQRSEYQTSKNPLFRCFHYSDPHFTSLLDEW